MVALLSAADGDARDLVVLEPEGHAGVDGPREQLVGAGEVGDETGGVDLLDLGAAVELADGVRSMLTLVFYLNEGFVGGETDFVELDARVVPRRGPALLFQHRVMHRACEVQAGEKLVLRTDVLYRPA